MITQIPGICLPFVPVTAAEKLHQTSSPLQIKLSLKGLISRTFCPSEELKLLTTTIQGVLPVPNTKNTQNAEHQGTELQPPHWSHQQSNHSLAPYQIITKHCY